EGFTQNVTFGHGGRTYQGKITLVGAFQGQNAGIAAGVPVATRAEPSTEVAALERVVGAQSRVGIAWHHKRAPNLIDYAHKPDALKKVLQSLRPYARGNLVVVLGAGGDRDTGKRPIMGRIAVENADRVIVTDDNPRSENPGAIRAAILAGAKGAAEI